MKMLWRHQLVSSKVRGQGMRMALCLFHCYQTLSSAFAIIDQALTQLFQQPAGCFMTSYVTQALKIEMLKHFQKSLLSSLHPKFDEIHHVDFNQDVFRNVILKIGTSSTNQHSSNALKCVRAIQS